MLDNVEAETEPVKQKQDNINYFKQKGERKLNASASSMLMLAVSADLSKKLEGNVNDPNKRN